jgi:hypothetical protein
MSKCQAPSPVIIHEFWLKRWVHQVYQVDAAIALRRLVSSRKCDYSLKRLLEEMYVELKKRPAEIPNVNLIEIAQDLAKINRQKNPDLNKILKLTDKDYAHHCEDQSDISDKILTEDFFAVSEDIINIFVKYYIILNKKNPHLLNDDDKKLLANSIKRAFVTIGEVIKSKSNIKHHTS